jgi:hypothetical protein
MQTRASVVLSIALCMTGLAVMSVPTWAQGRGGGAQQGRGGGAPRVAPALPPAGPIPRTADGKPNLEGVFSGMGSGLTHTVILEAHTSGFGIRGGPSLIIDPPDGIIPYQPWALVERNKRREDVNAYEDPVGHCEFYDIGRLHSFAQRFMYTGGNIAIAGQEQIVRIIDMNRKQHLPASIRLWNGDPIGWWEGDTLVIETTNFNGRTRMALGGDFYSPNARVVERYTMKDSNTITWTMTITDPTVFTRPWTFTSAAPMTRQVEGSNDWNRALRLLDPAWEHDCHEGNVVLRHMRNVYEKAYGGKWRQQTVPGSVPAAAP